MQEAEPVGELFRNLYDGFYWHYNGYRDQRQNVENSPASDEYINEGDRHVWGLDLTEPPGTDAGDVEHHKEQILYAVVSAAVDNREQLMNALRGNRDDPDECASEALRNLSNAWRDEFALAFPRDATFSSSDSAYKHRAKTAEWRITKCYYAIYKSVSAIRNIKGINSSNHNQTLNQHRTDFLRRSDTQCLYQYPFNFNPKNEHFFKHKTPYPLIKNEKYDFTPSKRERIRRDFSEESKERIKMIFTQGKKAVPSELQENLCSFYQLMKGIREWANYIRGGILARLYGEGYAKSIDRSLQLLAHSALTTAEVAVITSFGIDEFRQVLTEYQQACEEGFADSHQMVTQRFEVYEQALSDF